MEQIAARTIGYRRTVCFKAGQIDAVTAKVDLLVVGMFERHADNQPTGGADRIDRLLHGTLGRLREGEIFKGIAGETLTIATPPAPLCARSLMLVGLGDGLSADCGAIAHPTELAMRTALRMRARSVGCLLASLERDIPSAMIEACAATMMQGAMKAIDEHRDTGETPALDWVFDIRANDMARVEATLGRALEASS
ncbi:M17 family peptidase N-terminal domain-containing protein [Sphingobium sp. EM0848]|uniref:M17 family peptidase N-terminal domain-containing protein n=1 Tax=Sphingobium sp. EM0848 TaxID=2743473 RepID=UPI00159C0CC2|nr:M17 family peptidase N-terminal domain-containing protein [Sphingobium sp. EM0848]